MTDIVRLAGELKKPQYGLLDDKAALAALKDPTTTPIPPPPDLLTMQSVEASLALGDVSQADVAEARKYLAANPNGPKP